MYDNQESNIKNQEFNNINNQSNKHSLKLHNKDDYLKIVNLYIDIEVSILLIIIFIYNDYLIKSFKLVNTLFQRFLEFISLSSNETLYRIFIRITSIDYHIYVSFSQMVNNLIIIIILFFIFRN